MSHIELLVYSIAPLISKGTYSTFVSLSSQIFAVESVTFGLFVDEFLSLDGLHVYVCADYAFTVTATGVSHWAAAKHLKIVFSHRTARLEMNLTLLGRVCRCAVVGSISFFLVIAESDSSCFCACRLIRSRLISQTSFTKFSVLGVLFQSGAWTSRCLLPAKLRSNISWVHLHARFYVFYLVLLGLEPAVRGYFTLIVFGATQSVIPKSVFFANGFKGPFQGVVTVKTRITVRVRRTCYLYIVSLTYFIFAVVRFTLFRQRTRPPWVHHLIQVSGVLACSWLSTALDLRMLSI